MPIRSGRVGAGLTIAAAVAAAAVGAVVGTTADAAGGSRAGRVEGTLIGQASIAIADPGPLLVSGVTVTLASDAATRPLPGRGPVLLIVLEGTVVIDGPGRPANAPVGLGDGDQLALAAGAEVRLRNLAEEPATVLAVEVLPAPTGARPST